MGATCSFQTCWLIFSGLHSIILQKIELFIATSERSWNILKYNLIHYCLCFENTFLFLSCITRNQTVTVIMLWLAGPTAKRRKLEVDERELRIPLEHGWRRETVINGVSCTGVVKGEVTYYSPCGRRFKQYPDVVRVSIALSYMYIFLFFIKRWKVELSLYINISPCRSVGVVVKLHTFITSQQNCADFVWNFVYY